MRKSDLELLVESLLPIILTQQEEILAQLTRIRSLEARIMAAIDDLNNNLAAAQATINGNVNAAADAIIAKIGTPVATEAQLAAAAQAAADLNTSAQAVADKLNAASA